MKKNLTFASLMLLVMLVFITTDISAIQTVSFLHEDSFAGVDDDTSGWSTGSSMINLQTSIVNLLSGNGLLTGYNSTNIPGSLTHRGIRGLGVYGGENDEVDNASINSGESIEINFSTPQKLSYI